MLPSQSVVTMHWGSFLGENTRENNKEKKHRWIICANRCFVHIK